MLTDRKLFSKVITFMIVAVFVFNNVAIADVLTSSHLKTPSRNGSINAEQMRIDMLKLNPSDQSKDGGLIALERNVGKMSFGKRIYRMLYRMAINNGTAHGNNYDKDGNLIETKQNLRTTAGIAHYIKMLGVWIVQHGVTGTPVKNLPVLRDVGIESAHVGTHWQNIVWETMLDHQDIEEVRALVADMVDAVIAGFGSDKKYNVAARSDEAKSRIFDLKDMLLTRSNVEAAGLEWINVYYQFTNNKWVKEKTPTELELKVDMNSKENQAKMQKILGNDYEILQPVLMKIQAARNLDKLLGKELKNVLGKFQPRMLAMPEVVINDINERTKNSGIEFMQGLNSVGTRTIIKNYLVSEKNMPVSESALFKNGYEPDNFVSDNLAVKTSVLTAGILTAEQLRGKALTVTETDKDKKKKEISSIKDVADGRAKQLFQQIANKDTILIVRVSEGFGRDEVAESFTANEVVVPDALKAEQGLIKKAIDEGAVSYTAKSGQIYKIEDAIIDVIEGTNSFVSNVDNKQLSELKKSESGGTSIIVTGLGVRSLGNCPDDYTDGIFTTVPASRRIEFVVDPLDPEATAKDPGQMETVLARVADANGISINDIEVVLMDRAREAQRLAALQQVQKKYSGLDIIIIKDGTVAHTLLATFGRKEGKHKVVMTVGGAPEGFLNLAVAGLFAEEGAVGSVRIYSKDVNKAVDGTDAQDLNKRYAFTDKEKQELRELRPADADAIISGKKLFTQENVVGDVAGSFSFITNNGVFGVEGAQLSADGNTATVNVMRVGQLNGLPNVWFEQKLVDVKGETLETVNPKAKFVYKAEKYASIPGRAVFQALRDASPAGTIKYSVMCANIRTPLSLPGLYAAADITDSHFNVQQAMSELGYTWPSGKGHEIENAREFSRIVKDAARKAGFDSFSLKGDHITVKVDDKFLADHTAQERVIELFTKIMAEKDTVVQEKILKAAYKEVSSIVNPTAIDTNVLNALKSVIKAFDLIKAEVESDYTVFAEDASFMPMTQNVYISAFMAGLIPETSGLEAEVGEIGGKENSTIAEALEFLTGTKYREQTFVDKAGTKFSKLVKQGPAVTIADSLDKEISYQVPADLATANKEGTNQFVFVVNAQDLFTSADGLLTLQAVSAQLREGNNVKIVLHVDGTIAYEDVDALIEEAMQQINEISGDYTEMTRDMFAAVVVGSAQDVISKVKKDFNADIYRVIGSEGYVKNFASIKNVVLQKAGEGELTLMATALQKALDTILIEGADSIKVAATKVEERVKTDADKFKRQIEAAIRV